VSPRSNKELAEQIVRHGGCLISENMPGTRVSKGMFVVRDRLQSALSDAVFPIAFRNGSGTEHAIKAAGMLGKPLLCPEPRYLADDEAQGPAALLRNGQATAYTAKQYAAIEKELLGPNGAALKQSI